MKRKRKLQSPLAGATEKELALYRAFATAVARWVKDVQAGRYRFMDSAWQIMGDHVGASEDLEWSALLVDFEKKGWDRLERLPQWPEISNGLGRVRLREKDPQAYQVLLLREELDRHKADCRCGQDA